MPKTMLTIDGIKSAVQLACRAPSLHNSQPWRWAADHAEVHLFLDPSLILGPTDRKGRQALISCGAVLDHFRVAMAAAGWTANIDRFPNPNDADHLASIDFGPIASTTGAYRHRADAILRRRTDRLPFAAPTDWESFEPALRSNVDDSVAHLDVLSDDARPQLAEASKLTESLRLYDLFYHTELDWWTGWFPDSEGIPRSSLVSDTESERVEVGRRFPVSSHTERRAGIPTDRSTILVLSTEGDSRADALACGEVLSSVLLDCTMAGMATCTLTHMTELATSRNIIATLIAREAHPQVLIRVGVAPVFEDLPAATPRRPLSDVLELRD
jgi:hypothetical protein